jgi:hypothetical protein
MILTNRLLCLILLPPVIALSANAFAAAKEEIPDAQAVNQMETRAQQASPREQCFLYTELVHSMTELAGQQILDGDEEKASATLKRVEHYTHLIHLGLARDTKRLKNAQMLMHHTAYRLGEYLHVAPSEDRPVLVATLKQLDQAQDELLTQVFSH